MPQELHCPKCEQIVTIGDQSAGRRVKCPHCTQIFLAPGITPAASDDDDWLQLDEDQPKPSAAKATTEPAAKKSPPAAKEPKSVAKPKPDAALLDPFGDLSVDDSGDDSGDDGGDGLAALGNELDEFTSSIEPLPNVSDEDDLFADLPPLSEAPATAASPAPSLPAQSKPAAASSAAQEFRVKCPVCGSILYAKQAQVGKQIRCDDCHSAIKVPAPPKEKSKPRTQPIERAKTFTFEESPPVNRKDPYAKSASDLLDAAEKVRVEETPDYDFETPSVREWLKSVFGIFLDPGVAYHWLFLSMMAAVPAFFAVTFSSQVITVGLFIGVLLLTALTVACGFAIMQSVANHEDKVSGWPEMDPGAWFGDLVVAFGAIVLAAAPVWAFTSFAFGASLLSVAITMFAVYLLFPFFLLSMMDMQSVFMPFSAEVARSTTTCKESWGGLYMSSGLLFFALFLLFAALTGSAPGPRAVISIFATIGIAFTYFAMIGRLAYAIGQPGRE